MQNLSRLPALFALLIPLLLCSCSNSETPESPQPPAPTPPPTEEATDLTANGAYANCFMVHEAGAYRFAAKHIDGTPIAGIATANWVWSTDDVRPEGLIREVGYEDGYIRFEAAEGKGNALIAAFDSNGAIVWSWHIWQTDKPANQQLDNGTQFMDRNLGATSARIEDGPQTYGLKYQWGRKDPFYGGATNEVDGEAVFARAVENTVLNPRVGLAWNTTVCSPQAGTVAYARQHPTTFIYATRDVYPDTGDVFNDWMYVQDDYLWSDERADTKTNYDPCPAGYRIPEDDAWSGVGYYNVSDFEDGGRTHLTEGGTTFWWPLCGTRWGDQDAGRLGYVYLPAGGQLIGGGQGIYWKRSTNLCGHNAGCFYILNGTTAAAGYGMYRAHGCAVRCEYVAGK